MKFVKAVALGAVLIAGAAFAQAERTDPNAIARSDLMKTIGKNTGILGGIAKGEAAYDAATAEAAKAALVDAFGQVEVVFKEQGGADPADEAKPEIWANWDDFLAHAKTAGDAAAAIDVASAESIGAGLGALGGASPRTAGPPGAATSARAARRARTNDRPNTMANRSITTMTTRAATVPVDRARVVIARRKPPVPTARPSCIRGRGRRNR